MLLLRCYVLAFLCALGLMSAATVSESPDAGRIHFAIRSGSDWDFLTDNPSASTVAFFNSHYWRFQTTPGYFDHDLPLIPNAWAYIDSYAIYRGQSVASQHPDWILHDGNGNDLYIPWGCNGTCPQYAADITNASFRDYWISQAKADISAGYKGLWIDDVNLQMKVGDGWGNTVAPIDSATKKPMTVTAWEHYFADFMSQVRAAIPNAEILHNAIWYAGSGNPGSDPYVQQEIRAANWVNREHGVLDGGITGDNGYWSIQSLFRYVDTIHSIGSNFSLQETSLAGPYSVAAYFLVSEGRDAFGSAVYPSQWISLYDVALGSPQGSRYDWGGTIRRDFTGGSVFLVAPGQPAGGGNVGPGFVDINGTPVSSVSLNAKQGLVLLRSSVPVQPQQSGLTAGVHVIRNTLSGMFLDDPGISMASGTALDQWDGNGGTNQQWNFQPDGSGGWTVQNVASGLYLTDVSGTAEQVWYGSSLTKRWTATASGAGYVLTNRGSGLALDDAGCSMTHGTAVITWAANGGNNQVWTVQ